MHNLFVLASLTGLLNCVFGLPACSATAPGDGLPDGIGCSDCHGSPQNPAPPTGTADQSDSESLAVGAHQAHLTDGAIRQAVGCASCHLVPASVDQPGHIDPLPAELVFSDLSMTAGLEPVFDREAGTCSGTWCHGAGLSGGLHSAPLWTQVDGSQITCHGCHGFPPPAPHPASFDCSLCHPGTVATDGTIDLVGGNHINGVVETPALACDSCHGDASNPAPPLDTQGGSDPSLPGVGAHRAHLADSDWHAPMRCAECHRVPVDLDESGHNDSPLPAELTWGPLAGSDGAQPAYDPDQHTCASVYCHGATLLPGGSLTAPLWTRVDGSQAACGTCHGLPPGGQHPADPACETCHGQVIGPQRVFVTPQLHINGRVEQAGGHPQGYADPALHGQDLKQGLVDCRTCHGQDLTGAGAARSCDDCHPAGWRVDCTFCHGGLDNQSGAPPVDLRDRSATSQPTVGAHSEHLARSNHPAYACTTCHQLVSDLLSPGHLFDSTPGRAEVDLGASLSPQGVFAAPGCSNLYCHGTGLFNAAAADFTGAITSCDACHPGRTSGGDAWDRMSGEHKKHLEDGFGCQFCHDATIGSGDQILDPDRHVNGVVDVVLSRGTWNPAGRSCTGTGCHGTKVW